MTSVAPEPSAAVGEFPITPEQFFSMIERKELEKFHEFGGVSGIARAVQSDLTNGVPADVAAREQFYGKNELPEAEAVTFLGLLFEALKDKLMLLLICAATLSIILGMTLESPETGKREPEHGWIEGCAILISVAVVVLTQSINDYQKAKKFAQLNKEQAKKPLWVIRGGNRTERDASELLVGDIVEIGYGLTLPVDGVLIDGQDVKADESTATGESDIQKKNHERDPFLLSGTDVVEGAGRMLVISVGIHSFCGKLMMGTRAPPSETPLQLKLGDLADKIGKVGVICALATLIVLSARYLAHQLGNDLPINGVRFLNFVIICISIVVVCIPEGLPLAVTIALAYSMKSMLTDNCLVRVLASCETMGACTAICSDKTGTLTTNKMTVVQGWVAGESFYFDGYGLEASKDATKLMGGAANRAAPPITLTHTSPNILRLLGDSLSLNSTAEEVTLEDGTKQWSGNKTEHGILGFVLRSGFDFEAVRKKYKGQIRQYPFSSSKKRMTTLVDDGGVWMTHVKGASELVLQDCTHYYNAEGSECELSPVQRSVMETLIEDMANQGNRTIAVAIHKQPSGPVMPEEEPNPPLSLIAILGIQDPIREEVPIAVARCQKAGIVVRMVTGDNINTAMAIAKKCGIYNEATGIAMEGKDFRELAQNNQAKLQEILPRLQVLARSSPTDKHVLVASLMEQGNTVAVTGDGTNDAPALTLADVGFAMKSGTDVAKRASDMILMDDNFASVVRATMWGRSVNDNVRKFLQFQLIVNVVGVLMTFIGSAVSEESESPLKAVQLLWLNLIMDTMAALALATERPTFEILDRPPVYRQAPLITWRMWGFIAGHGIFQLTVILLIINFGHEWFSLGACRSDDYHGKMINGNCKGGQVHATMVFNLFIWFQIFNMFNARKLYNELNPFSGIWSNARLCIYTVFVEAGFQVFAVEVAGKFMNTVPLTWWQWLICIGIALFEFPVGLIVKLLTSRLPEWKAKDKAPLEIEPEKAQEILRVVGGSSNSLQQHQELAAAVNRSSKNMHHPRTMPTRKDVATRAFSISAPGQLPGRSNSIVGMGTLVSVREA